MAVHSLYWQDGMFMWPHHMQQEMRFQSELAARNHKWDVHHNWGMRSLDLDPDALKNGQLVIRSLRARLRDGTILEIPGEGRLPFLDLNEVSQGKDNVTIYLALPELQDHRGNVGTVSDENLDTRYVVETSEVEDENTGTDPQPLEFRRPNVKLLADMRDGAGYDIIPIARFARSEANPDLLQLDEHYIPPVLACDAWHPLGVDILQFLFHRLSERKESLARQAVTRGITFETQHQGDNVLLGQLAVLNEATAILNVLAFAEGIHPLPAYVELCRLVGKLSIFPAPGSAIPGRAPELPAYDHDDLYGCFSRVKRLLEVYEPAKETYEEREFVGEKLRMQVAMEAKWLEPAWQMFVGVQSPAPQPEVIRLLTKQGELNMKIGSGHRVDEIYQGGKRGLEFTPVLQPPRLLPTRPGLTYFQVNRDSQKSEWAEVQQSHTLAIRLNQHRIVAGAQGDLQGQRVLTIRLGAQAGPTTMQFALFLVPSSGS